MNKHFSLSFPQSRMLSGGRESFFKKQEGFSMRVSALSRSDRTSRNDSLCERVKSREIWRSV